MNTKKKNWMLPLAGTFLVAAATARAAEPAPLERVYLDSTNRLTASIRFGMNISGKFKNPGGSLNPHVKAPNPRHTPDGDAYNYDDGYVLTDNTGNVGHQTWNWGYDSASQLNASAPNSIDFHRDTAAGLPGSNSGDDSPYLGCEVAFARELVVLGDKHPVRLGIDIAANFMPINFNSGGSYNTSLHRETDTYGYTPGTTPPTAPYQGSFSGPGFLLGSTPRHQPATTIPGPSLDARQSFDSNLWGFRLGPYLETPLTEKLSLHFSGGMATGILDADANWRESTAPHGGGGATTTKGGGSDTDVLWGYYLGADAVYRLTERWGLDVGVQYQDLGTYSHNFGGRVAELDLSRSLFVQAGVSFSF
jgi:hypothetical protein